MSQEIDEAFVDTIDTLDLPLKLTATDLLKLIKPLDPDRDFPRSATGIGKFITRLKPLFAECGINIKQGHNGRYRWIQISRAGGERSTCISPVSLGQQLLRFTEKSIEETKKWAPDESDPLLFEFYYSPQTGKVSIREICTETKELGEELADMLNQLKKVSNE